MYVPGFLDNIDKVNVEIGTGYYAEKVLILCFAILYIVSFNMLLHFPHHLCISQA